MSNEQYDNDDCQNEAVDTDAEAKPKRHKHRPGRRRFRRHSVRVITSIASAVLGMFFLITGVAFAGQSAGGNTSSDGGITVTATRDCDAGTATGVFSGSTDAGPKQVVFGNAVAYGTIDTNVSKTLTTTVSADTTDLPWSFGSQNVDEARQGAGSVSIGTCASPTTESSSSDTSSSSSSSQPSDTTTEEPPTTDTTKPTKPDCDSGKQWDDSSQQCVPCPPTKDTSTSSQPSDTSTTTTTTSSSDTSSSSSSSPSTESTSSSESSTSSSTPTSSTTSSGGGSSTSSTTSSSSGGSGSTSSAASSNGGDNGSSSGGSGGTAGGDTNVAVQQQVVQQDNGGGQAQEHHDYVAAPVPSTYIPGPGGTGDDDLMTAVTPSSPLGKIFMAIGAGLLFAAGAMGIPFSQVRALVRRRRQAGEHS